MAPLSVLLSRVLVPLVWDLDAKDEGSLALWADLLRVLPEEGALQRDLTALAHVSPRSLNVLVTGAERRGLVTTAKASKGGTRVHPTAAAGDECRAWEDRLHKTEARWRRHHATQPLTDLLRDVVGQIEVELPWLLLPYGPSDNSASVGPRVLRTQPPDGLPFLALLSQLLAALAVAYEAAHGWMLSMMVTAFDEFPDDGLPVAEIHPWADVRGNGKTVHERHGIVTVVQDPTGPPIARLTPKGLRLRDRHWPTIGAVERELTDRIGADTITALRRELGDVAGRLPNTDVRHLCMAYRSGPKWVEASARST